MKKIMATAAALAIIACGVCMYSVFGAAVNISYDFENDSLQGWSAIYGNADMTIESESNGNKFLRLSYNGEANRDREYYDVKAADINTEGILQVDYDVMYPEIETEKNGEMQVKYCVGPGSAETTFIARVGKNMGYFRLNNDSGKFDAVKDISGHTLGIEAGHWYSVKLIVDLDNNRQILHIYDRDTQELLSYGEWKKTISSGQKPNMIAFSSEMDMCIDNVAIYNSSCESAYILGEPYVSSATKNKYFMIGVTEDGSITAVPEGTLSWSLETEHEGVSADPPTGRIIVGSNPEPGPVIFKAENVTDEGIISAKQIVYVSK